MLGDEPQNGTWRLLVVLPTLLKFPYPIYDWRLEWLFTANPFSMLLKSMIPLILFIERDDKTYFL